MGAHEVNQDMIATIEMGKRKLTLPEQDKNEDKEGVEFSSLNIGQNQTALDV